MGLDITRLANKIKAAFAAYNDTDMTQEEIEAARNQIPIDLATAIIEEITAATVTVPGSGLLAGSTPVSGSSITGSLS